MSRLALLLVLLAPLRSQDLSGKWCAVSDPQDCLILRQNGEALAGSFVLRNTTVGEAAGWSRNGSVAMGFRRLDNAQVATFNAVLDSSGRLLSRTLNPDGGLRWNGVYTRAGNAVAARCGIPLEPGTDRYAADYKTVRRPECLLPGLRTGPEVPGVQLGGLAKHVLFEIHGAAGHQCLRNHVRREGQRTICRINAEPALPHCD